MNDKDHPVVLACAADDNYSMPVAVMLYSALRNYQGDLPVHVYVLDGGISEKHRQKIGKVLAPFSISVRWLDPSAETLRDLPLKNHLTASTYHRLLIPELLPQTVTKAIYLDCDLLVEGDLARLWELDIGDCYFLAAQDLNPKFIASPLASCPEIALKPDDEYFNAGVLIMNLAKLREDAVASKVIEFSQRWPKLIRHADQDGLNVVALRKWRKIDPQWNWHVKRRKNQKFAYRPNAILHYNGSAKPWLPWAKFYQADDVRLVYRRYDEYAKASGWFTPIGRLSYVSTHAFHHCRLWTRRRVGQIGRAAMSRVGWAGHGARE